MKICLLREKPYLTGLQSDNPQKVMAQRCPLVRNNFLISNSIFFQNQVFSIVLYVHHFDISSFWHYLGPLQIVTFLVDVVVVPYRNSIFCCKIKVMMNWWKWEESLTIEILVKRFEIVLEIVHLLCSRWENTANQLISCYVSNIKAFKWCHLSFIGFCVKSAGLWMHFILR